MYPCTGFVHRETLYTKENIDNSVENKTKKNTNDIIGGNRHYI
jgi:hypothetical protein